MSQGEGVGASTLSSSAVAAAIPLGIDSKRTIVALSSHFFRRVCALTAVQFGLLRGEC